MEEILFSKQDIDIKIDEMADNVAKDYLGKKLVIVGVLTGAFQFTSDLTKKLWEKNFFEFEVDFVKVESYGNNRRSSQNPKLTLDVTVDVAGKNILIVEDIIETGLTVSFLMEHLNKKGLSSIKICALLSKKAGKTVLEPDYLGWRVDPGFWVEGYGMDSAAYGRGRPYIIKK